MKQKPQKKINKKSMLKLLTLVVTAIFCLTISSDHAFSQANSEIKKVSEKVNALELRNLLTEEKIAFTQAGINSDSKISEIVKNYTLLKKNNDFKTILSEQPEYLKLKIPFGNTSFTLLLYKVNLSPSGLTVLTGSGTNQEVNFTLVNYRGIIENDNNSVAAITFSANETMGLISNADGNYVLGRIEDNSEGLYIIYNDMDLVPHANMDCGTKTTNLPVNHRHDVQQNKTSSINCVNWYWETDLDIYNDKDSVSGVIAYMTGIFNQVSTLYANDGMTINLQTIFVWDVADPYSGPSTSNYLNQFGAYRTSFAGDLANLFGYNGGGGVAYVDGFCSNPVSFRMGYCGINASFQNVPTYSWTVEVTAHEEGHLFGSQHTHDCVWNGNNTKIDACGDDAGYPSGSCPLTNPVLPVGGGTIMSYCHLTSAGINFSLGFGPQPKTLMLNNVNNSSCLGACIGCQNPPQPGNITANGGNTKVCPGSVKTYHVNTVSGATSYTWLPPTGATVTSGQGTNNATVTFNSGFLASDSIKVKANNTCGSSPTKALFITRNKPASPSVITGQSKSLCNISGIPYSVTNVAGMTYNWSFNTANAAVASGQGTNSITANYNSSFTTGTLTVTANNACGASTAKVLDVKAKTATPGTITGASSVCANQQAVPYSIAPVSGATSYTWIGPNGVRFSDGVTTSTTANFTTTANAVTANFKTTAGNIQVKANNACGASSAKSKAVTINCKEGELNSNNLPSLSINPNPAHDQVNISFITEENVSYTIEIVDVTGRILQTVTSTSTTENTIETLDVSTFAKGMYLIRLSASGNQQIQRFIIE